MAAQYGLIDLAEVKRARGRKATEYAKGEVTNWARYDLDLPGLGLQPPPDPSVRECILEAALQEALDGWDAAHESEGLETSEDSVKLRALLE